MYLTKKSNSVDYFNWNDYYTTSINDTNDKEIKEIHLEIRKHLKEDLFNFSFIFTEVMQRLLKDIHVEKPNILEIGAGTGFLTRWLIEKYGGAGMLIDNNEQAYKKFKDISDPLKKKIEYKLLAIEEFENTKQFDIVCSFGLIEHFEDKQKIIDHHKKYVKDSGYIIIIVPMDTPLTRVFYEAHPELNSGYRELLTMGDLNKALVNSDLNILNIEKSFHYSYDFLASISILKNNIDAYK